MGELFAWLISFFILIGLLVIIVFQLMCLADLEFDYINPYDSASRINKVIIPEFFTQGGLCLFFLVTGHWFMALLCVPCLYCNVKMYMDNQHLVDVTEIFNMLHWEKKKRLFKLAYLIFILFLSLFWMIWTALEDDENYWSSSWWFSGIIPVEGLRHRHQHIPDTQLRTGFCGHLNQFEVFLPFGHCLI